MKEVGGGDDGEGQGSWRKMWSKPDTGSSAKTSDNNSFDNMYGVISPSVAFGGSAGRGC